MIWEIYIWSDRIYDLQQVQLIHMVLNIIERLDEVEGLILIIVPWILLLDFMER
jgi:hypothetical protein